MKTKTLGIISSAHLSSRQWLNRKVESTRRSSAAVGLLALIFATCFCFTQPASADTVTIDVRAFIDGRDLLIIKGHTLQWHHLDNAAVGRHQGDGNGNEPTIITTTRNGKTVMDHVNWIPNWPFPPPNEIRFEAFSSVFDTLKPHIPTDDAMTVTLTPIAARSSLTIAQLPSPSNDFTTILDFNDDPVGGADWYEALLTISTDCSTNVTRESQDDPRWAFNLYGQSRTATIEKLGSALTSLSMVLNAAGITNDPGFLNQSMSRDTEDADYSGLGVNWGPATRDQSGGALRFNAQCIDSSIYLDRAKDYLDTAVCDQHRPVIVGVDLNDEGAPRHYVVVEGRKNGDYQIADP